jgi:hypothetical protein
MMCMLPKLHSNENVRTTFNIQAPDDLVILVGALSLEQDGTIAALRDRIKVHLQLDEARH